MKFKLELLINKPRAEVWKFFCDHGKTSLWQPTLTGIEILSGTAGEAGTESKWAYNENDREFSLTEKVLQCKEPQLFESLFENDFAGNTVKNSFTEHSPHETLWVMETTYRFKTLMMKVLGPILKKNYVTRSEREMERFKEAVEGQ